MFADLPHIVFTCLSICVVLTSVGHLSLFRDTALFWRLQLEKDQHIALNQETFALVKAKSRTDSSILKFNLFCFLVRSGIAAYMAFNPKWQDTLVLTHTLNLLCLSLPLPPVARHLGQMAVLGYTIRCTDWMGSIPETLLILGYEDLRYAAIPEAASISHRRKDVPLLPPSWTRCLDWCPSCHLQAAYTKTTIEADVPSTSFQGEHCIHCWSDWVVGEEVAVLVCGHVYHEACIQEWYEHSVRKTCPLCKRQF